MERIGNHRVDGVAARPACDSGASFEAINGSLHAFPVLLARPAPPAFPAFPARPAPPALFLSQALRAPSRDVGSASWDRRHAWPGLEPPPLIDFEAPCR